MKARIEFTYSALPARVIFGTGSTARLAAEVERLGLSRVLVLATPEQGALAEGVVETLGGRAAGLFAEAAMHVPIEVAERARDLARTLGADGCVAVGGGSTIGLGKAIALEYGLPVLAVPTTYAGSEMTSIWGITRDGAKTTGRDDRVLPRTVLYDPALTLALPVRMSMTSGINAIAHAIEALYAPDRNPVTQLMAEEGIRALAAALPAIEADPAAPVPREEALYGAWLCGSVLGSSTMSLHHKLCHTLGGSLNLPHAETHAVVLPHVAAFNLAVDPQARAAAGCALGADDPAAELHRLARAVGAPTALSELGVTREQLTAVAGEAVRNPYWNPRPFDAAAVEKILEEAWCGAAPSTRAVNANAPDARERTEGPAA